MNTSRPSHNCIHKTIFVVTYFLYIDRSVAFSIKKIWVMFFKFFNFNASTIYSTSALWKSMIPKKRWTQLLNFGLAFWKFNQLRSEVLSNCMWNIFYHICHRMPAYTKSVRCFSITPVIAYIVWGFSSVLSFLSNTDLTFDKFRKNCLLHPKVWFPQWFVDLIFFELYPPC